MGYNKDGTYRVNLYLNPKIEKDKVIINYLEGRYSAPEYIKETLFTIAQGQSIAPVVYGNSDQVNKEIVVDEEIEVADEIIGLNDIEL